VLWLLLKHDVELQPALREVAESRVRHPHSLPGIQLLHTVALQCTGLQHLGAYISRNLPFLVSKVQPVCHTLLTGVDAGA
jgi:hypothetical protein